MEPPENLGKRGLGELAKPGGSRPAIEWNIPFRAEPVFTWEQAVRILWKNARFALLIAGTLSAACVLTALSMKNVYQPVARLQIDPVNSGINALPEIADSRGGDNQDYLETQVYILQSDALAMSIIRALHLDSNPEFVRKKDVTTVALKPNAGQQRTLVVRDGAYLQEQMDLANRTAAESTALAAFRQRLTVNPIRNTRLIEVSFLSSDPKLAQLVTNTLVSQFIDQNYRHHYNTTMQASGWLSSQLNDLRQVVEEANQAVTEYQKKYDLTEVDDRDVPLAQLMGEVNHQLSDAQASRIETEAYVRMIDLGHPDIIPALRDDQVYQALMTRYADVRAQLAQARTIYGDESSNVKKLVNESNELAAQVEAERSRMAARVRLSLAAAKDREQMMLAAREKLKGQMGDASSHMVAYRLLRNEAVAKAELYNTLQARLKEAGIYAGLRSSNINVVDMAAQLTRPTGPHRTFIMAAGVMISCMLGVLLAFVRESLDNTIRTPDDVRLWTGLPSLGMLPKIRKREGDGQDVRPHEKVTSLESSASISRILPRELPDNSPIPARIPLTKPYTAEAEAMRSLRTGLLFSSPNTRPRVILVSSSVANEGKTTIASNLALALAHHGKTCLVEGDLRRPMIGSTFGLTTEKGLSQVLSGTVSLELAIKSVPGRPNLSLLPAGPPVANPEDLIDSKHMEGLALTLRDGFDFVVIDSPPIIPFADARVLATFADVVALVGRYGLTTRRAITRSAEILGDVGAPVIGVVLNDMDFASPDYHYFNYGYSRIMSQQLGYEYYSRGDTHRGANSTDPQAPKSKGAHA